MKKILSAAAFALTLLALSPSQSRAEWNKPQQRHGFGWWPSLALNTTPWIHFHGPLYNYGPYTGPGHVPMAVKNPWSGSYMPAYPQSYYGYQDPIASSGIIPPNFHAAPQQTLTAPTNLYYSQAAPSTASPVASAPQNAQPAVAQPSVDNYSNAKAPGIFGQFRTGFRR